MINFLKNAPQGLKTFRELFDYAVNLYKQRMGVFPEGIDKITIQRQAANLAEERQKIVKFPEGGKDKTDFFTTRPDPRVKQPPGAKMDIQRANENIAGGSGYAEGDTKYNADILGEELARMRGFIKEGQDSTDMDPREYSKLYDEAYSYLTQLRRLNRKPPGEGELSVTIEGQTKNMTPEGIMNFLMGRGKGADTNIGKAPKTKKTKPAVDPELQKAEDQKQMFLDFEDRIETEAEMLERMKRQNKESVERLKKKKEKDLGDKLKDLPDDIDPDAMADGGRIGFGSGSVGAVGFAGNQTEQSQPQGPGPMGPVFETGDIGAAAKEVMTRMAGPSSLLNIPMGRGFGLDFGLGARRSIDAGISFNPQNPNFDLQLGVGALQGKPVIGAQFRKQFKDGSKPKDPSKRTFLKTMAGLASIPFVGKFFKPAAKVAETAGPAIAEGVKLGFDKFMMLVDKIKRLGRKTDRVTQTEREEGFIYTGKDGSQYELVEDLVTGDVRITKDKPGVAVYNRGGEDVEGIDVIDDRSTFYLKRNQADETTKGKKPPDEYDEVRELPDEDGTFTDVDEVSDNTVNEILEELGETRTKKASGGLAYMLGE